MATTTTTTTYTLDEVAKHRGRESCWIIINAKVYDVTKYLDEHPGGDEEILNESGTDATKAFADVSHSSDAKEILETLMIGNLHPDDVRALAWKNYSIPWAKITAVVAVPAAIAVILVSAFAILSKRK